MYSIYWYFIPFVQLYLLEVGITFIFYSYFWTGKGGVYSLTVCTLSFEGNLMGSNSDIVRKKIRTLQTVEYLCTGNQGLLITLNVK